MNLHWDYVMLKIVFLNLATDKQWHCTFSRELTSKVKKKIRFQTFFQIQIKLTPAMTNFWLWRKAKCVLLKEIELCITTKNLNLPWGIYLLKFKNSSFHSTMDSILKSRKSSSLKVKKRNKNAFCSFYQINWAQNSL